MVNQGWKTPGKVFVSYKYCMNSAESISAGLGKNGNQKIGTQLAWCTLFKRGGEGGSGIGKPK